MLPNKSIARFSSKLNKEALIKTHGLKRSFKVLWIKYVTCIGLFVVLHSVLILGQIVLVSLLLVVNSIRNVSIRRYSNSACKCVALCNSVCFVVSCM